MYNFINRLIALILIFIFFPIFLLVSLYLIILIGNPIIFKQKRSGHNGKIFYLYKFRTMSEKKHKKETQRLIKSTMFLRNLRLDELPQLINIIKGDLHFVGPRPLLPEYNKLYNSLQKKRLDVMPGITGWAQVNGDNNINWSKKFNLDIWYVKNRSLFLDIKIIFLTVIFVCKKIKGSKKNKLIMEKFNGKN